MARLSFVRRLVGHSLQAVTLVTMCPVAASHMIMMDGLHQLIESCKERHMTQPAHNEPRDHLPCSSHMGGLSLMRRV